VSTGVSIVGAGLSKFGRQPDKSGRDLALDAIAAALRDAGLDWPDVQVAFGGSDGAGLADTLVADLGLTGIPEHPLRDADDAGVFGVEQPFKYGG